MVDVLSGHSAGNGRTWWYFRGSSKKDAWLEAAHAFDTFIRTAWTGHLVVPRPELPAMLGRLLSLLREKKNLEQVPEGPNSVIRRA